MRVLFLDVDGVLNNRATKERWPKGSSMLGVDPTKVAMIKQIIERTGCIVVLSSTWRLSDDTYEYIKKLLPIYDKTGHRADGYRGLEVQHWMDDHRELGFTAYAILDDDPDFTPTQKEHHLFATKFMGDGLTDEIKEQVIAHLNKEGGYYEARPGYER